MLEPSCRLFVYGSMLKGEPYHGVLGDAEFLGAVQTAAVYQLFDLGPYPALVADGTVAVVGELYRVDRALRARVDVALEVPVLFERGAVRLADGTEVEAYVMSMDKVRGRRRLRHGDWRARFSPFPSAVPPSPWKAWARSRRDLVR